MTTIRQAAFPVFLIVCQIQITAQEWTSYGGDPGGTKYSALRQIDCSNGTRLKPVWIYHTGDVSDGTKWPTRSAFETTPLAVDGVLFLTTPFSRVAALDASKGRELWSFDPKIDRTQSTNLFVNRGAAYWRGGSNGAFFWVRSTRWLFGGMVRRIAALPVPTG